MRILELILAFNLGDIIWCTEHFYLVLKAYINHTLGVVATGYCRQLGVPISQFIDDRLISVLETSYYDRIKVIVRLSLLCILFVKFLRD